MPTYGTKIGVYPANGTENDEVSSTYYGRHLTFLESEILGHEHTWVTKGHPVVVGEHIVGVVLAIRRADGTFGAAATAAGDFIDIDTEGIFNLSVVATDEDGNVAVVAGDELFIHKTSGIISKNYNKQSHTRFGYALGSVSSSNTAIIAVKIHWNPSDAQELVGTTATPQTSSRTGHSFREYRYESSGGGTIYGDYLRLNIASAATEGIAGRSNLTIAAAVAQAYGRHDTVTIKSEGSISQLAVGHRAGYLASDAAQAATIAGGMSELWAEGASTDFAATAVHSIHRFVMDGNATGHATALNVFEFVNMSSTQYASNSDTADFALRVIINNNIRYIKVAEATS